MPRKPESRSHSKPKIKVEMSSAGKVNVGGKQSGERAPAVARPSPTLEQLDARQEAVKKKRKASGPVRTAKAVKKVSPSDVPPVEPR